MCITFWWDNVERRDTSRYEVFVEDNIKMDFKELMYEVLGWIQPFQNTERCQTFFRSDRYRDQYTFLGLRY